MCATKPSNDMCATKPSTNTAHHDTVVTTH